MSHTKATVLLAGLAMGLGGTAIAQTSSLDEARSFAAETRSDATRATLSQGADAGPEVFGRVQFQYNVTLIEDPGAGEDFANGFQIRRARLGAKGEISGIGYYVQGDFGTNDGVFDLKDFYLTIPVPGMEDEATITAGIFKLPFLFEENTSSSRQLAVARSFTNDYFAQGRSEGIMLTYAGNEDDDYRAQVAFSDGFNTAATRFDSPMEADWGIGGRFDYKLSGAWSDFKDFTSTQGQEQALRFGGGIFYQSGDGTFASGTGATMELDLLSITADGQWEQNGISVYGAFIFQDRDMGTAGDATDLGFIIQGGYRWDENNEVFGRFDYLVSDNNEDLPTLTFGYNHYVFGDHSAKFTADVFFVLETVNDTDIPGGIASDGLLPDAGDPQVGLRTQFQFTF
ncbi:MAG: porin [Phycisphaerales bacterium]